MKIYQDTNGNKFQYDPTSREFVPLGTPASTDDHDFSAAQMLLNVPKSTGQFVKDSVYPFVHPIRTTKAVTNLAIGIAGKLFPGKQEQEFYADQFVDLVKQRYGSVNAFQRTLESDPVGVLSDVAGLAMAAGGAAGKAASAGSKMARYGAAANEIGRSIDPAAIAVQTAGKVFHRIPGVQKAAEGLYAGGAKFPTSKGGNPARNAGIQAENVRTALRERLTTTDKGVGQLQRRIGELGDQINDLIDNAPPGARVDVDPIIDELQKAIAEVDIPGNPNRAQDVAQLTQAFDGFVDSLKGADSMTIREAQAAKQLLGQRLNFNAKPGTQTFIGEMGEQAIRRGERAGIESQLPEIAELNAKQAALLELRDPLSQAARRTSNRNLIGSGIDLPLNMLAGAAAGTPGGTAGTAVGTALGAAVGLAQSPRVQQRTAIIMQQLIDAGRSPEVAARTAPLLALQAERQAGRAGQQQELQ